MSNHNKKVQLIGLDIQEDYLEFIEDFLFKSGLFKETNSMYVKGKVESIDYNIESVDYLTFYMEYKDNLVLGRATIPTKAFRMFKAVFDYYQHRNSKFKLYLIKDPSYIDTTIILSKDVIPGDLLGSVLNTIDVHIPNDIVELYNTYGYQALINNPRIPNEAIKALKLISNVANEILDTISRHKLALDFENGRHYKLAMHRGMVIAEVKDDIRVVRYNNIVAKIKDSLNDLPDDKKENNNYTEDEEIDDELCEITLATSVTTITSGVVSGIMGNDDAEISDEHWDMMITMRSENNEYKKTLLKRLVNVTERLEEGEVTYKDKSEYAKIPNIEIINEDNEEDEE